MYTDQEFQQLTAAGFAELDADWFENQARTWGILCPDAAYGTPEQRADTWILYKQNPTDGATIETFERYTLAECLQIVKEFES